MLAPLDVAAGLVEAVRGVRTPHDLDATLHAIAGLARDAIGGFEHVGIVVADPGGAFGSRVATAPFAAALDELQGELGEGPGLDAVTTDVVVRVAPVAEETRWPRYTAEAVGRGVCAQVAVRLHADTLTLGVLTATSVSQAEVSPETERLVELIAAHASVVLGTARQVDNLNAALASRQTIGLALGLVMERHRLDEEAAFAYLTRISATTETKLREVASGIVVDHRDRLGNRT